jgi:hypothetical protein
MEKYLTADNSVFQYINANDSTTHSWQWLLRNLSVSCRVNQFFFAIILMWYTRNIYNFFSSTEHCAWAIISPKEFKSCVTRISFAFNVLENRIICCQIFFQRIFNVLQLILVSYWLFTRYVNTLEWCNTLYKTEITS